MNMNIAQAGGEAEMPGMVQAGNKVTIEKMPDGSYQVEMAGHDESMMEDESAEAAQSYTSAMEACQAAISMLDGGGDADEEVMQGYNGPRGQMKKMGVKEVFGG